MGNNSASAPARAGGAIGYTRTANPIKLVQRDPDPEIKLILTGPAGAGKTTLLYTLKLGEIIQHTIPTGGDVLKRTYDLHVTERCVVYSLVHCASPILLPPGFNVETIPLDSCVTMTRQSTAIIWDLGGSYKLSPLFRHYYPGCRGIIFVVPNFGYWVSKKDGRNSFVSEYNSSEKPGPVKQARTCCLPLILPRPSPPQTRRVICPCSASLCTCVCVQVDVTVDNYRYTHYHHSRQHTNVPPLPHCAVQNHYKPSWIHYMRQQPELRGVPLLVVVNERSGANNNQERAQLIAAQLGVARHQVHERPCRVITVCLCPKDPTRDVKSQFLSGDGLGWFYTVDREYSRGGVWVSLPLTTLLPLPVRRTSPALRLVVACLGTARVSGFVTPGASKDADWVLQRAHLVVRDSDVGTGNWSVTIWPMKKWARVECW